MGFVGQMRDFGDSSTFSVYKVVFSVDKKQSRSRKWPLIPVGWKMDFSTSYPVVLLRLI